MDTQLNTLLLAASLTIPAYAAAFDTAPSTNPHEELCYGRAMIGYDSVINSRLGVPAEHALYLAQLNHTTTETIYSKALLNTIWDAYLWKDTPHAYALKVFYRCATEDTTLRSAKSDWIVTDGR